MKAKKIVTLLILSSVVMCVTFSTNVVNTKAATWTEEEVAKTSSCVVNGIERTLIVLKDGDVFLKVGERDPFWISFNDLDVGLDKYGTVWTVADINIVGWWNYDYMGSDSFVFLPILKPTDDNPNAYVDDAESLVLDEQGLVVGYKTISGEIYPIPTIEEMTAQFLKEYPDATIPTLVPSTPSTPTPTPSSNPTTTPVPTPTQSPNPVPTPTPTPTPVPETNNKISIKKSKSYKCLCLGDDVVSKYQLKKGVLTYKANKTKKYKNVKSAGYIQKSKSLIFMTKKGQVYTVTPKGKKKCILKKGAKKLVLKNGFVTKVKKKSGYLNVMKKG